MSNTIADNLQRLVNAKGAIASAITNRGGTVGSGDGLEDFASDIAAIPNSYAAGDEGKVVSSGALVAQSTHKQISTNGTGIDTTNYASVDVAVPNSYSADDEGKVVSSGALVTQSTHKSITANATGIDTMNYSSVDVSVPNSYSAGDEGKVVSNGALVAQGSDTVTQNGTVDTTLISSLFVNVSGASLISRLTPSSSCSDKIASCDAFIMSDNASSYVYVFGIITPNAASVDVYLDIPSDFPSNLIGAVFGSACGRPGGTSTSDYYYIPNLQYIGADNQIRLGSIASRNNSTLFVCMFDKST